MATNERVIPTSLLAQREYDTFQWARHSTDFIAATDVNALYTFRVVAVTEAKKRSRRRKTSSKKEKDGNDDGDGEIGCTGASRLVSLGESIYVTVQIMYLGQPLTAPIQSSHSRSNQHIIDEWLMFPIAISDLPIDAVVTCNVYGLGGLIGGTSFYPFTSRGELKTGVRQYRLYLGKTADGAEDTTTCGHIVPSRLARLARDKNQGCIPAIPWLDRLTEMHLAERDHTNSNSSSSSCGGEDESDGDSRSASASSSSSNTGCGMENENVESDDDGDSGDAEVVLTVEFPVSSNRVPIFHLSIPPDFARGADERSSKAMAVATIIRNSKLCYVDYDIGNENVCEAKAATLSKSLFLTADSDVQPSQKERKQLAALLSKPLIQLEGMRVDETALLWRFRYFLVRDQRAFVPFMQCVDWLNEVERQEAKKLMQSWKQITFADALVCLSNMFAGVLTIRQYAVHLLSRQPITLVSSVLLQLVQAVRYDVEDELASFLIQMAVSHWEVASTLYWYFGVEADLEKHNNDGSGTAATGTTTARRSQAINSNTSSSSNNMYSALRSRLLRALQEDQPLFILRLRKQQKLRDALATLYSAMVKDPRDRVKRMELGVSLIDGGRCGISELFAIDGGFPHSTSSTNLTAMSFNDSMIATTTAAAAAAAAGGGDAYDGGDESLNMSTTSNAERGGPNGGTAENSARSSVATTTSFSSSPLGNSATGKTRSSAPPPIPVGKPIPNEENSSGSVSRRGVASGSKIVSGSVISSGGASSGGMTRSATGTTAATMMSVGGVGGDSGFGAVFVTLPTHPTIAVDAILSKGFYMFKSAMMPIMIPFAIHTEGNSPMGGAKAGMRTATADLETADDALLGSSRSNVSTSSTAGGVLASTDDRKKLSERNEIALIFKQGDDVRQDQLVIQLIRVMDAMLQQDGLDLCLTPYRVLATGRTEGLVEVVPNVETFQSVQRDVVKYIRKHNPTPERSQAAMNRFIKSVAGYCVITFILGIGDRHLENILITHDGRLLHIDFGYILGNDPKPFPPPMKINKEMVEALGGPQSDGYTEFKTYCCSSYNILRKHARLLLSMMLLMVDAGMPQISGDGKMDPRVNLLKVQDKMRLDLSNAQATQYIQNVIADSVGSIFTNLWDVIHAAAQATRH